MSHVVDEKGFEKFLGAVLLEEFAELPLLLLIFPRDIPCMPEDEEHKNQDDDSVYITKRDDIHCIYPFLWDSRLKLPHEKVDVNFAKEKPRLMRG